MSRSSAKAEKIRADRDRLLAAGQPYEGHLTMPMRLLLRVECHLSVAVTHAPFAVFSLCFSLSLALQLYKTAVSRARTAKQWSAAEEMATDGAAALLKTGGADGAGCGGELAAALIELYQKSGAPCGPSQVRAILELAALFPAAVSGSDPAKDALVVFLKVALKWSQSVAPPGAPSGCGCPDFHLALARRLAALGEHGGAHLQYLRSGGAQAELSQNAAQAISEHAALLVDWASPNGGGLQSEADLFVARAVLQYLCLEDLASANALLKHFAARDASLSNSPLLHFASFLTEVCERSAAAAPLFDVLRAKYAAALSRDPKLDEYLEKIAEVYLGREAPKSFMESMMAGLDAKPKSANVAPTTATPAPAAAPPQQQQPAHQQADDAHMAPAPDVD